MKNLKGILAALCTCFAMSGCVALPSGIDPVTDFESQLYVGTWYEIARLDNRFERGLSKVTATYTSRADGGIDVVNRGYKEGEKEPKEAIGKAYSVGDATTAHLKVSDYQFAFVSGNSRKYLWLLARTPNVDESVKKLFLDRATTLGFDIARLVWVDQ